MRKIVFSLAVAAFGANLAFGDTFSQEQINEMEKQCGGGDLNVCTALGEYYFENGIIYDSKQDYAKARYYSEKVCTKNNIQKDKSLSGACYNLGSMYDSGCGVSQNYKKALQYYSIACDADDFVGCFYSAFISDEELHDNDGARKYYRKACEVGKNDGEVQNNSNFKKAWIEVCDKYEMLK